MMLDNAREHGVDVHEGVRVLEVLFEGDRAVGVRIQDEDGVRARGARQGRRRRQRPERAAAEPLQAARVGSGAEQRRHLDLLGGRLSRHGPRRRGDDGPADRRARRAGSGTSRCTTTSSASAWSRRSTTCSRAAASHEQIYHEEVERCPAVKERVAKAQARDRLLRHQGLLVSLDAGRRRRLGAGRRRLRLPRSALFVRRAAGAASPASWPPTRSSKGWPRATLSAAQLGKWGPAFNQGMDRMRRLVCEYYDGFSFGQFVQELPAPARQR